MVIGEATQIRPPAATKPCTRNRAPSMPSPTPEQPFEGPNNSGLLCNPQPDPQDHSQRTSPWIHRRRWINQRRDREKSRRSLFQKDATEPLSLRQSQETDTPTKRASKSPPETRISRDSSTSQSRFQHHCKIRGRRHDATLPSPEESAPPAPSPEKEQQKSPAKQLSMGRTTPKLPRTNLESWNMYTGCSIRGSPSPPRPRRPSEATGSRRIWLRK